MQEVLMLFAASLMVLSVFHTATLDAAADSHFNAALTAQGLGPEAGATARALVLDALGPGDGQRAGGYKCMVFDVAVTPSNGGQCRTVHLAIAGAIDAELGGRLCPDKDGQWTEAPQEPFTSHPVDLRWRDSVLRKGADLYREAAADSPQTPFDWPDTKIQIGGYVFHDARTFALIRLPNGETRYARKEDLITGTR